MFESSPPKVFMIYAICYNTALNEFYVEKEYARMNPSTLFSTVVQCFSDSEQAFSTCTVLNKDKKVKKLMSSKFSLEKVIQNHSETITKKDSVQTQEIFNQGQKNEVDVVNVPRGVVKSILDDLAEVDVDDIDENDLAIGRLQIRTKNGDTVFIGLSSPAESVLFYPDPMIELNDDE